MARKSETPKTKLISFSKKGSISILRAHSLGENIQIMVVQYKREEEKPIKSAFKRPMLSGKKKLAGTGPFPSFMHLFIVKFDQSAVIKSSLPVKRQRHPQISLLKA